MYEEMLKQAKQAKSVEELMTLAKENGIDLSVEETQENFNMLHAQGELGDNELDNVAGGGCGTVDELCKHVYYGSWDGKCPYCGGPNCTPRFTSAFEGKSCHVCRCDDCGNNTFAFFSSQ